MRHVKIATFMAKAISATGKTLLVVRSFTIKTQYYHR